MVLHVIQCTQNGLFWKVFYHRMNPFWFLRWFVTWIQRGRGGDHPDKVRWWPWHICGSFALKGIARAVIHFLAQHISKVVSSQCKYPSATLCNFMKEIKTHIQEMAALHRSWLGLTNWQSTYPTSCPQCQNHLDQLELNTGDYSAPGASVFPIGLFWSMFPKNNWKETMATSKPSRAQWNPLWRQP